MPESDNSNDQPGGSCLAELFMIAAGAILVAALAGWLTTVCIQLQHAEREGLEVINYIGVVPYGLFLGAALGGSASNAMNKPLNTPSAGTSNRKLTAGDSLLAIIGPLVAGASVLVILLPLVLVISILCIMESAEGRRREIATQVTCSSTAMLALYCVVTFLWGQVW